MVVEKVDQQKISSINNNSKPSSANKLAYLSLIIILTIKIICHNLKEQNRENTIKYTHNIKS